MTQLNIITPVTRPHNLRIIADSIKEANDRADGAFDITWYCMFDTEEYGHVQLPHDVGVFMFARPCFSGYKKLVQVKGEGKIYKLVRIAEDTVLCADDAGDVLEFKKDIVNFISGDKINSFGCKQRNYALDLIGGGYVYFLDDDNVMKDSFLVDLRDSFEFCENKKAFIFDLVDKDFNVIQTAHYDNIKPESIDTAQFVLDRELVGNIRWAAEYRADGKFISEIYALHPESFQMAIGEAYYNFLR